MKILVTGTAGFIGFHTIKPLLERGDVVVGLDSINDYYDVSLKEARLAESGIDTTKIVHNQLIQSNRYPNYHFVKMDLTDRSAVMNLFETEKFDRVCNLAAQAGVRYSLENPYVYMDSNISGFLNILEACRHTHVKHLVYASSSSVYGLNETLPFSTSDNVDHPISLYAATKKSNELMAHTYSYLYQLPTTGLRFFTVYGPWGRPDMALFLFTKAILEDKEIHVFNNGEMVRDFTYIDDIVDGMVRVIDAVPSPDQEWSGKVPKPNSSIAPYRIYNIGNQSPVKLMEFIQAIEEQLGKKAKKKMLPMQAGDVPETIANVDDLVKNLNYKPTTTVQEGIRQFINWYKKHYRD
ncbi:MAG: NAD-dependent epimerase [Calditrichaeota bacterium]|nr:NAD-dependent epimerase [Calditrichota bacterium]